MKKWIVFFVLATVFLQAKTVYFVHIGGIDSSKYFYDYMFYRDEVSKPFVLLRETIEKAGFDVKFTYDCADLTDVAAIISINDVSPGVLANIARYPTNKCFLLVMEPPVTMPNLHKTDFAVYFDKIFTLFDDPIDNKKYFKLYYPQPHLKMLDHIPDFSQKKLCVLINGNKGPGNSDPSGTSLYPERRTAIKFFTRYADEFDLFGPDWHGYEAWRGYVNSKWATLKNYRFNICYENMTHQRGYITEKIIDSLVAGCVPIYWGADNIADYIPKECFIDKRDFPRYIDLLRFMLNMDRATYEKYLAAMKDFFESPKAQAFSSEHFINLMMDAILPHAYD